MAKIGRREFLGTAAAAGLLAGCKVSNGPAAPEGSTDLAKQLQGMAEQMLAEYPENATILGIAERRGISGSQIPVGGQGDGVASDHHIVAPLHDHPELELGHPVVEHLRPGRVLENQQTSCAAGVVGQLHTQQAPDVGTAQVSVLIRFRPS